MTPEMVIVINKEINMKEYVHILRHSLGLDSDGNGTPYRNHFCTGEGSVDFDQCRKLVEAGYMIERKGSFLSGGDSIFHVTEGGKEYAKS